MLTRITGNQQVDPTLGVATTANQGQAVAETKSAVPQQAAAAALPSQVLLAGDSGIKMLLSEMAKLLDNFTSLRQELPPAVASAVASELAGDAATESSLPQGVAALIRQTKAGPENLVQLARQLEAAAAIVKAFPAGLPAGMEEAATAFVAKAQTGLSEAVLPAAQPGASQPAAGQAGQPSMTGAPEAAAETVPFPSNSAGPSAATAPAGGPTQNNQSINTGQVGSIVADEAGGPPAPSQPAAVLPQAAAVADPPARGPQPAPVGSSLTQLIGQLADPKTADLLPAPAMLTIIRDSLPPLPAAEKAYLSLLGRALNDSLPASLAQPSVRGDQAALRDAAVLARVADSGPWLKLNEDQLKTAAGTLRAMAADTPPPQGTAENTGSQKTLSLALPLYLGPEAKPYPAYIHISQEGGEGSAAGASAVRDTWLRLILKTDNIGTVDMVFHVWGSRQLSIRVGFSDADAVGEFRRQVPAIREQMADTAFSLTDVSVVSAPAK